jgi:hypothetical protein
LLVSLRTVGDPLSQPGTGKNARTLAGGRCIPLEANDRHTQPKGIEVPRRRAVREGVEANVHLPAYLFRALVVCPGQSSRLDVESLEERPGMRRARRRDRT